MPYRVDIDTVVAGTDPMPKVGDQVFMNYKAKLASDGTVFDESRDIPLPVKGIFPKGTPFPIEEGATIPSFFVFVPDRPDTDQTLLQLCRDASEPAEP